MARPFSEIISARGTAIGATPANLTANTGDTFTLRNLEDPELLALWVHSQVDGVVRIFGTPKPEGKHAGLGHDTTQGFRLVHDPTNLAPLFDGFGGVGLPMVKGDVLDIEMSGSAVAGDEETAHLLIYYKADLARVLTPAEVQARFKRIVGIDQNLAAVASSNYTSEQALNADFSLLHADTEYAILGYVGNEDLGLVGFREATMTGGRRVGGPLQDDHAYLTKQWFVDLSIRFNRPMIPVFRQGDAGNVLVDAVGNEVSVTPEITVILAELHGKTAD